MMKKVSLLVFLMAFLAQCKNAPNYQELIQGKWKIVRWASAGGTAAQVKNMDFHFHGTSYHANLGDRTEYGSFRIEGDTLTTVAESQPVFKVKIVALTADSLVLQRTQGSFQDFMTFRRP